MGNATALEIWSNGSPGQSPGRIIALTEPDGSKRQAGCRGCSGILDCVGFRAAAEPPRWECACGYMMLEGDRFCRWCGQSVPYSSLSLTPANRQQFRAPAPRAQPKQKCGSSSSQQTPRPPPSKLPESSKAAAWPAAASSGVPAPAKRPRIAFQRQEQPSAQAPPQTPKTVAKILSHMTDHSDSPTVQAAACKQLSRIAASEGGQNMIAQRRGVEQIIQAMVGHPAKESMQREACAIIRDVVTKHAGIRLQVAEARGAEAVIAAMRKHCPCSKIVIDGSWVLQALSTTELGRQRIALRGGIGVLTQAMRDHPSNLDVQEAGCSTFGNLAFEEALRPQLGRDCLEVVMDAMRRYSDDSRVQDEAALFLHNLVCDPELARYVKNMGGQALLEQALKKHPAEDAQDDERLAALGLLRILP